MKKLLTLTGAALVLSSSFAMAADQLNSQASDNTATQTAYQYDSSDDNGRSEDQ